MRRLGRIIRMLDAGRLAGRHVLARWILRTVELLVALAYGGNLIQSAWHHLAGAGRHAGSLVTPIIVALGVLALAAVLLAERHHRRRQQRQRDASTGERRAADPETERRHVAAISLAWVVGGIVLACAATAIPVGPAILRAVVATAVACGGALRGWRIADRAGAPRPAWTLAVGAARDDAPPGLGVPVVVAGTFVAALAGALGGLPIGGLGIAAALVVAMASRRDVGRRWATEELAWWRSVGTEIGAERVQVVRTIRPDPVSWPTGADSTTRQELRRLVAEFDDSGPERLAYEYVDRHDAEVPLDAAQAAVEERDARFGATVSLTADRVAGDVDTARDRLAERLGDSWAVVADASGLRISITPAEPERLPSSVPLVDLLPEAAEQVDVDHLELSFALSASGEVVSFDATVTPHGVIAGETGAGKTILLTDLAVAALANGWQLAICEVTKGGLDFLPLRDWACGFAAELPEAIETVRAAYAEVRRRRGVLHQVGAVKWQDVDLDMRDREGIRPMLLIFDEVASALIAGAAPKGLNKRHPLVREAEERLAATAELRLLLGRIAREARFVGISLLLGIQRPDVSILGGETGAGGELRANLGFRAQLAPPRNLPSREAVAMLFSGEATAQALAELARLNDGVSRGLAVVHSEGGAVRAVRVAYNPPADVPALLDRLGVPRHVGPRLGEASQTAPEGDNAHPLAATALPATSGSADVGDADPGPPARSGQIDGSADPHAPSVSPVPHAPGAHGPSAGPIVVRRPDGTVRRVVALAPGPDAERFGVEPRWRVRINQAVAEAERADDLIGLIVPGHDDLTDELHRAAARVRWAREHRLAAQARAAGPCVATVAVSDDERAVLAGVAPAPATWTSAMPLVLVDADYADDAGQPAGNIVWFRAGESAEAFLVSAATIGWIVLERSDERSGARWVGGRLIGSEVG